MNHELMSLKPDIDSAAIQQFLEEYGEQEGIRGLEGRIVRGLDPASMLAVPQTRERLGALSAAYGADSEVTKEFIKDLHVGGIWKHADELAAGSPAATVWMVAGEATVRGKTVLGDLTSDQFVDDTKRVIKLLDAALDDPQGFAEMAHANLISKAESQFMVEDGIGISDVTEGFLAMAVSGHKSGIVRDAKNRLLFVGANQLNFEQIAQVYDLTRSVQEDRGRDSVFYIDTNQERRMKQLYPGFGIVMNADMALARSLALTAIEGMA